MKASPAPVIWNQPMQQIYCLTLNYLNAYMQKVEINTRKNSERPQSAQQKLRRLLDT